MSYNPHAKDKYKYGGELYHGRKAIKDGGAPNGYSNTPGYKATGEVAVGRRLPDGRYIYPGERMAYVNRRTMNPNRSMTERNRSTQNLSNLVNGRTNRSMTERNRSEQRLNTAVNGRTNRSMTERNRSEAKLRAAVNGKPSNLQKSINTAKLGATMVSKNVGSEVKKTKKKAGNWLNERLDDAGKAFNTAKDWLGERANDAGKAANRAGEWLKNRGIDLGNTARNVGIEAKKLGKKAVDAVSNQDELAAYKRALQNARANPSAENQEAVRKAREAYNNHLLTKIGSEAKTAKRNLNRTARNVKETARNVADAVGREVKWEVNTAKKLGKKAVGVAKDTAKNARDFVSNADERKRYEDAKAKHDLYQTPETEAQLKKAEKEYKSHLVTRASDAANNVAKSVKSIPNTVRTATESAVKTVSEKYKVSSKKLYDFISNTDEYKELQEAQNYYDLYRVPEAKERLDAATKAYENHVLTKLGSIFNKKKK